MLIYTNCTSGFLLDIPNIIVRSLKRCLCCINIFETCMNQGLIKDLLDSYMYLQEQFLIKPNNLLKVLCWALH